MEVSLSDSVILSDDDAPCTTNNRLTDTLAVVAYNSGATTQQCNQRVVGRDQHGSLTVPSTITQSSDDDDDVFCVHRTTTSRVVDDLIAFVHDE